MKFNKNFENLIFDKPRRNDLKFQVASHCFRKQSDCSSKFNR